jgi:hypothetical protein
VSNSLSKSYHPEFGTRANACDMATAITVARKVLSDAIGLESKHILDVLRGEDGPTQKVALTDRQLRVIRFCLTRTLESI